jgi:magnesium-protoporphyrin O-methyltransferase
MTCCARCAAGEQFDDRIARRDLRRFRRRGPDAPTQRLIQGVLSRPVPAEASLLDIGGGVGAIHHALLDHGFANATHLDASQAYLTVAAHEAQRAGHGTRVQFRLAEFPQEAASVLAADVVTLDRVVCCNPDYVAMLGAAASHARRLLAFSYPRSRLLIRMMVATANGCRRLFRRPFRAYVHPPAAMRAELEAAGMHLAWAGGTWVWAVEIYERAS